MKTVRIIETEFKGPTDSNGARVIARVVSNRKTRLVHVWDYAKDAFENHEEAVKALCMVRSLNGPLIGSSAVDGGGYLFVQEIR